MPVRKGDVRDIPQILVLAKELLEQSPVYAGIEMNDNKFKRTTAMAVSSKRGVVFVIVDDDDIPQGFIMGFATDLFFSDSRYVTDCAVYARKSARSQAGWMVRRFIRWAKTVHGVKIIPMAISSGMGDMDRIGALYERLGLVKTGGLYVGRVLGDSNERVK